MTKTEFDAQGSRSKRPCPIWVDAFQRDTQHLSADEVGAYFLIIMAMWSRKDCAVFDNQAQLARIARVSLRLWKSRIAPTLMPFFTVENGLVLSNRLRKEATYVERQVTQQRCRKTGENPDNLLKTKDRPQTTDEPRTEPRHLPSQQPNNPTKESSSIPLTLNGESVTEIQSPPTADDDDFSAFGILKDAGLAVEYDHRGSDFWARDAHTAKAHEWRDDHGLSRKAIVAAIKRVLDRRATSAEPINSMKFFEAEVLASKNANAATKPILKVDRAEFWATQIREGRFVTSTSVNAATIEEMIGRDLVTPEQVIAAGLRIQ